jgi:hypothetical protein
MNGANKKITAYTAISAASPYQNAAEICARVASLCCTTVLLSESTSTRKKSVRTAAAAASPKSCEVRSLASKAVKKNVIAAEP